MTAVVPGGASGRHRRRERSPPQMAFDQETPTPLPQRSAQLRATDLSNRQHIRADPFHERVIGREACPRYGRHSWIDDGANISAYRPAHKHMSIRSHNALNSADPDVGWLAAMYVAVLGSLSSAWRQTTAAATRCRHRRSHACSGRLPDHAVWPAPEPNTGPRLPGSRRPMPRWR